MDEKMLRKDFIELYGDGGDIREYFSPGRVNLIGEHTDYNGGHVFPCALTLGTYGIMRRRNDNTLKFSSANVKKGQVVSVDMSNLKYDKKYSWANYPLGIVWALKDKGIELESGFEMLIWGNIPNGSGLSSSASIEVLMAKMIQDQYEIKSLNMLDLAGIPLFSKDRKELAPIICAGGPCACNIEPMADFFDVVCWRSTAEFVCRYFGKGALIAVDGQLQSRTYQAKDGTNRYVVEVVADNVSFTGERRDNSGGYGQQYGVNQSYQPQQYGAQQPEAQSYGQYQASPANDFAQPPQPQTSYQSGSNADFQDMPLDDDLPF